VVLVKNRQKPTPKPLENHTTPHKPTPGRCEFSNQKPTSTHIISTSKDEKSFLSREEEQSIFTHINLEVSSKIIQDLTKVLMNETQQLLFTLKSTSAKFVRDSRQDATQSDLNDQTQSDLNDATQSDLNDQTTQFDLNDQIQLDLNDQTQLDLNDQTTQPDLNGQTTQFDLNDQTTQLDRNGQT
jgi:hypothetical protein